tara:strand:- start:315 stop:527 length:213 start_codon:yes stop_codon:yes gene_type:complete
MKNKKLIFVGIGLVGAYLLYKKYGKKQNTKNQRKDYSKYKTENSCVENGGTWSRRLPMGGGRRALRSGCI